MSYRPTGFAVGGATGSQKERERTMRQRPILLKIGERLTGEDKRIFEKNPHIRQVFACEREFKSKSVFTESDRVILLDKAEKEPYRERKDEIKTTYHKGQLKLLLVEIEFLTRFAQPEDIVIYAGAAPGDHHEILGDMFPFVKFILYDPNEFKVNETDKREIHQEFFSDRTAEQLAEKYRNDRILFISDIRRFDKNLPDKIINKLIVGDMNAQMIWVNILSPVASHLKMRLPYGEGFTEYLDGTIFVQPRVGSTSTESRLEVTDRFSRKVYSNKNYEDVFFYHNTETRTTYFGEVEDVPGSVFGCHCYDCATELYIIGQYVKRFDFTLIQNLGNTVQEVVRNIDKQFK